MLVLAAGAAGKAQVQDFTAGAVFPVLVASYESIRLVADQLAGYCDLLICDEGHRCCLVDPDGYKASIATSVYHQTATKALRNDVL